MPYLPPSDTSTTTLNDERSSVLESSTPQLVWLYAGDDCPQCETLLPFVEQAAGKLSSWGVSVAAVDLSKETKLRRDLSVPKGLPMMFKASKLYTSMSLRTTWCYAYE